MADWEEIRQLAADFRRVQNSNSTHKLSERNCIELVSRLIDTEQLQVVYTLDGKEYITPVQIEREIQGELIAHRGGFIVWLELLQEFRTQACCSGKGWSLPLTHPQPGSRYRSKGQDKILEKSSGQSSDQAALVKIITSL